jgi:hypothetical protein
MSGFIAKSMVNLIRQDPETKTVAELGNALEPFLPDNATGRILRRVEDQETGPRGNQLLHHVEVKAESLALE